MSSSRDLYDLLASRGLGSEEDYASGFHLVWAEGLEFEELGRRLGADVDNAFSRRIAEASPGAGGPFIWGGAVGAWAQAIPFCELPDNSYLRLLSRDGGRALSIQSAHNNCRLDWAVNGEIVTFLAIDWPDARGGTDPHALDSLMEGLRFELEEPGSVTDPVTVEVSLTSALRLAARITGHEITGEWLDGVHTAYAFSPNGHAHNPWS
ncbi:DUF6461 domain-containing protein [Microbispora rosea]|uniref:DUF6461 domain-containing protein n=1 Tax=Microbispora rosea TaxID=58117 RepID=UPI00341BB2B2